MSKRERGRKCNENMFSIMAFKPINIHWIRTGSQPYGKIMYSIVVYSVFYKYKKCTIILYPRKAVYNTMREITIPAWLSNRVIFTVLEPVL